MSPTEDLELALRGAALRVTRPRLAVLDVLRGHAHATTDEVLSDVRDRLPEVSHQAVYDVLRALTAAGLVRRIEPQGSVARYEVRVGDNHHHLVCRSCGTIADVDCAVGSAPCLTPRRTTASSSTRPRSSTGVCAASAARHHPSCPPSSPPQRGTR
ncbi:Fur family transcriptional regulator [Klenkia terrae]|uniref:Fur family transcriptional regulator n=1 Tax=Klenkia terrae TaxID=1052259 RepID=UPI003607286E